MVLSLTRCRELLPASEDWISDSELEALREQLYQLARLCVAESVGRGTQPSDRATSVEIVDFVSKQD